MSQVFLAAFSGCALALVIVIIATWQIGGYFIRKAFKSKLGAFVEEGRPHEAPGPSIFPEGGQCVDPTHTQGGVRAGANRILDISCHEVYRRVTRAIGENAAMKIAEEAAGQMMTERLAAVPVVEPDVVA